MSTQAATMYMHSMIHSHMTYCLTSCSQANHTTLHYTHYSLCENKHLKFWTKNQGNSTTMQF